MPKMAASRAMSALLLPACRRAERMFSRPNSMRRSVSSRCALQLVAWVRKPRSMRRKIASRTARNSRL
ncbi:hypothetical protein D3C87_579430 [compost metagenome]